MNKNIEGQGNTSTVRPNWWLESILPKALEYILTDPTVITEIIK